MKVWFATSNPHKLRELREMLPVGWSVSGLRDAGITQDIPETGATLLENSMLKAAFLRDLIQPNESGHIIIADDSGLEVNALDGRPGVHSARFAGEPANDALNNEKLLALLENVADRSARFVTVITLMDRYGTRCFEGEVKGNIATRPSGEGGFGYYPLFVPAGSRKTFAEMTAAEKNAVSHRALAVQQLVAYLSSA